MSEKKLSPNKRKRANMFMWAILTLPIREDLSWHYLLEWASLGGKPDEVIR